MPVEPNVMWQRFHREPATLGMVVVIQVPMYIVINVRIREVMVFDADRRTRVIIMVTVPGCSRAATEKHYGDNEHNAGGNQPGGRCNRVLC